AVRPVRRPRAGSWARAVFLDVGASAREEAVVSPSVHLAADGRLGVVLVPATGRGSGCAACSAVPGGLPGTGRVSRCRRVRPGAGRVSPSVYLAADGRLGAVRVPLAVGPAERADVGALAEGRSRPGGRLGGTGRAAVVGRCGTLRAGCRAVARRGRWARPPGSRPCLTVRIPRGRWPPGGCPGPTGRRSGRARRRRCPRRGPVPAGRAARRYRAGGRRRPVRDAPGGMPSRGPAGAGGA